MSKIGFFIDKQPTRIGEILAQCAQAGSPVALIAALDLDIAPTVLHESPLTKIVFRTASQFGADNGAMYVGTPEQGHEAGHAWVKKISEIWRLNPASYYAIDNEPGRNDLDGLRWYAAYAMGCMDQAQEYGFAAAIGNWSKGMPPNDPASIAVMLPMFRQAAQYGHCIAVHEYATSQPMVDDSACLRFEKLYNALPADARPMLAITEASPDVVFPVAGAEYVREIGPYDLALMNSPYRDRILGACLYRYGSGGESSLISIGADIAKWISEHPTSTISPIDDRIETLGDDIMRISARVDDLAKEVADVRKADQDDHIVLLGMNDKTNQSMAALEKRVTQLEGNEPPPPPPAPHDVVFGLHCRADGGDIPRVEYDVLGLIHGRVTGYKFLTGCSTSHYSAVINGQHYTPSLCMTRLFWDARGETVRPTPARFVELMRAGINDAWHFGVRCFELLNEPNLYSEWHANWGGPVGFVDWAIQVIAILRAEWINIRIISPGLAPIDDMTSVGENTDRWVMAFKDGELFNACDFVGAHAYWRTRSTMLTPDDGLNFRRYLNATSRPIWITEFSNNKANDTDSDKGAQYLEYLDYLRANEPRVERAYAYAMSSGNKGDNDTRQTWVRGVAMTDIARAVAA